MDAILPVYKPVGMTSYDVIRAFKKANPPLLTLRRDKIGHGGTLDPFADGVLLLLLGKATKKMDELTKLAKTYRATAVLGAKSDTLDVTGSIEQCHSDTVSQQEVERAALRFVGEMEQVIPDYSAAKINGQPRYKLARRGAEITPKSKKVMIESLEIEQLKDNRVTFLAKVSSGTYIRQLSYDLFKSLGTESYLERLTRTAIGEYTLDKCVKIEDFSSLKWQDNLDSI